MHTTDKYRFESDANTGYLQIAGTNSLLKGDIEFTVAISGYKMDLVLPKEGYVRAPIQSDALVWLHEGTVIGFVPPAEPGRIANVYTLAQVPESGQLSVPAALLDRMNATLAALAVQDERFDGYQAKVVVEDGYRRLLLRRPGGLTIIFR